MSNEFEELGFGLCRALQRIGMFGFTLNKMSSGLEGAVVDQRSIMI